MVTLHMYGISVHELIVFVSFQSPVPYVSCELQLDSDTKKKERELVFVFAYYAT